MIGKREKYTDTKEERSTPSPDLSVLSKSLFWDTDVATIDWQRQYVAVIQRVHERGTNIEMEEITRFYGRDKVKKALQISAARTPYTVYRNV